MNINTSILDKRNNREHTVSSVIIHHLGVDVNQSAQTVRNHHRNSLGWDRDGYHYHINEETGLITQLMSENMMSWGALNNNHGRIHIVLSGLFENKLPQKRGIDALLWLCNNIVRRHNITLICTHSQLPSQNTACAGAMLNGWVTRNQSKLFANGGQQQEDNVSHTIKRGETLSSIARLYNTTTNRIATLNHIKNPNVIQVGQRLHIPRGVNGEVNQNITVGDIVNFRSNAVQYGTNNKFAKWTYSSNNRFIVIELRGSRAVITNVGVVLGAINVRHLRKIS